MRALFTVLIAFLLVLLQAAVLDLVPVRTPAPAFALLVALHVGFSPRFGISAAVLVSFATGYLLDLCAGAPLGAHTLVCVLTTLYSAFWARRLSMRGLLQKAAAGFAVTLVGAFLLLTVRLAVAPEGPGPGFAALRLAPLEALLTAIVAPPVLNLLALLDGQLEPGRQSATKYRGLPLG